MDKPEGYEELLTLCRADGRMLCMRNGVQDQKPCRVISLSWGPDLIAEGDTWAECLKQVRADLARKS